METQPPWLSNILGNRGGDMHEFNGRTFLTFKEVRKLISFDIDKTNHDLFPNYKYYDGWFVDIGDKEGTSKFYAKGYFNKVTSNHYNSEPSKDRAIITLVFTKSTSKPELEGQKFKPLNFNVKNDTAFCSLDELEVLAKEHGFDLEENPIQERISPLEQVETSRTKVIVPSSVNFKTSITPNNQPNEEVNILHKEIDTYKSTIETLENTIEEQKEFIEKLSQSNHKSFDSQKEVIAEASKYLEIANNEKILRKNIEKENQEFDDYIKKQADAISKLSLLLEQTKNRLKTKTEQVSELIKDASQAQYLSEKNERLEIDNKKLEEEIRGLQDKLIQEDNINITNTEGRLVLPYSTPYLEAIIWVAKNRNNNTYDGKKENYIESKLLDKFKELKITANQSNYAKAITKFTKMTKS